MSKSKPSLKPRTYEQVLKSFNKVVGVASKKEKVGILKLEANHFWPHVGEDITEWEIRKYGGFAKLMEESTAKDEPHPMADFTRDGIGSIVKKNDYQDGTFFITAAAPTSSLDWTQDQLIDAENNKHVTGKNVFQPGLDATENFLKRHNAKLVILPMPAHIKALKSQPRHYDPVFQKYIDSFATEYTFNSHLKAIDAYINPQQINPITGLRRLKVHKYTNNGEQGSEIKRFKTSLIIAHSKQMLDVVPTGNASHPRIIHSTGAITKPSYLRNRIGMIAQEDHKLGGLIVQIEGGVFYIRQVQFDVNNGSFIDLGTRYHADGSITEERAEAFKMGDLHPGHEDREALAAMYDLWDIIKPKRIYFEDFFDGASISHHTEKKRLTRAKNPSQFRDLPTEIEYAKGVLKEIWDKAPKDAKLIATASNHPDHVNQYLERGAYQGDCPANYDIGHRMVVMELDGKNALQEYLDPEKRMIWSDCNEDDFIEGVQMNAHGHLGVGGSRGSKQGHELAYGNAMTAHTHVPSIYHDAFTVGHMSKPRHGYNLGPANWILCSGAVYKGGQKQLYMIIKGKFQPNKSKKTKK